MVSSVRPITDTDTTPPPHAPDPAPPTTTPTLDHHLEPPELSHPLWIEPDIEDFSPSKEDISPSEENILHGVDDDDEEEVELQAPPQTLIFCDNSGVCVCVCVRVYV